MNYHIIRTGESIEKIAYGYNLAVEEITRINRHISNWEKLIPGTKIKLPEISNQLTMELDEVEPFIEDYYPKIELPLNEEIKEEVPLEPVLEKENPTNEVIKKTSKSPKKMPNYPQGNLLPGNLLPGNLFPYGYPYPYGYNYYQNYYRYHTKPKKRSR